MLSANSVQSPCILSHDATCDPSLAEHAHLGATINDCAHLNENNWSLSSRKRFFDCATAAIGLLLLSPCMALIAFAIAATSRGPILFRQRRMGRCGATFTVFKFRTMVVDAEQGSNITLHRDPRITGLGKVLRKFKLDELPQLINVVTGDMSLVGPRPKLPCHEMRFMPFRPGITGAATIAFRFEEELFRHISQEDIDSFYERSIKPMRVRLDWQYMNSATF